MKKKKFLIKYFIVSEVCFLNVNGANSCIVKASRALLCLQNPLKNVKCNKNID